MRVLNMLRGSYLFGNDAQRIIQDPESLRASSIRQGAAWEAWSELRNAVVLQANSSDHNPAVNVGSGPQDSWELATPQMMRFYVKGGAHSRGQHGYIVSNANWDPYPLANRHREFRAGAGQYGCCRHAAHRAVSQCLLYRRRRSRRATRGT
jgi:histidine ammonia-lyase